MPQTKCVSALGTSICREKEEDNVNEEVRMVPDSLNSASMIKLQSLHLPEFHKIFLHASRMIYSFMDTITNPFSVL